MRRPWIECETCRGWPRDGQRAATTLRATGRWRCRLVWWNQRLRRTPTLVSGATTRVRAAVARSSRNATERLRNAFVGTRLLRNHELVTAALQHDRSAGVDHPKMNVERRTDREQIGRAS